MAKYTISSGHIFKDLIPPSFDEDFAKVVLASNIDRMIEVREMTQKRAADFLEISQSKITELRHGQLKNFTFRWSVFLY